MLLAALKQYEAERDERLRIIRKSPRCCFSLGSAALLRAHVFFFVRSICLTNQMRVPSTRYVVCLEVP